MTFKELHELTIILNNTKKLAEILSNEYFRIVDKDLPIKFVNEGPTCISNGSEVMININN